MRGPLFGLKVSALKLVAMDKIVYPRVLQETDLLRCALYIEWPEGLYVH